MVPLIRGHLPYTATLDLLKVLPYNRGTTVLVIFFKQVQVLKNVYVFKYT